MPSDDAPRQAHVGRFVRATRLRSAPVRITVDGVPVEAQEGESLLVVILRARGSVRSSEFTGEPRAGFCLMGACQDCWVWLAGGGRARACTTPVAAGLEVLTEPPAEFPPHA
jgi:predicted molibdopterin-dependent oxidoreductase YjgC